jgi:hypothetical protein
VTTLYMDKGDSGDEDTFATRVYLVMMSLGQRESERLGDLRRRWRFCLYIAIWVPFLAA